MKNELKKSNLKVWLGITALTLTLLPICSQTAQAQAKPLTLSVTQAILISRESHGTKTSF